VVVLIGMLHAGGKWKTVAEVSESATTAAVSLFSLNSLSLSSPYKYTFRVFAVNARGLGRASPDSDSVLVSGDYRFLSI